ncbi:MAG: F-box protein, partial [Chlamydiia bacterium]|nr:F-box protein [Chlamydiia bacterium]
MQSITSAATSAPTSNQTLAPIEMLPVEIFVQIIENLPDDDIVKLDLVSRRFCDLTHDRIRLIRACCAIDACTAFLCAHSEVDEASRVAVRNLSDQFCLQLRSPLLNPVYYVTLIDQYIKEMSRFVSFSTSKEEPKLIKIARFFYNNRLKEIESSLDEVRYEADKLDRVDLRIEAVWGVRFGETLHSLKHRLATFEFQLPRFLGQDELFFPHQELKAKKLLSLAEGVSHPRSRSTVLAVIVHQLVEKRKFKEALKMTKQIPEEHIRGWVLVNLIKMLHSNIIDMKSLGFDINNSSSINKILTLVPEFYELLPLENGHLQSPTLESIMHYSHKKATPEEYFLGLWDKRNEDWRSIGLLNGYKYKKETMISVNKIIQESGVLRLCQLIEQIPEISSRWHARCAVLSVLVTVEAVGYGSCLKEITFKESRSVIIEEFLANIKHSGEQARARAHFARLERHYVLSDFDDKLKSIGRITDEHEREEECCYLLENFNSVSQDLLREAPGDIKRFLTLGEKMSEWVPRFRGVNVVICPLVSDLIEKKLEDLLIDLDIKDERLQTIVCIRLFSALSDLDEPERVDRAVQRLPERLKKLPLIQRIVTQLESSGNKLEDEFVDQMLAELGIVKKRDRDFEEAITYANKTTDERVRQIEILDQMRRVEKEFCRGGLNGRLRLFSELRDTAIPSLKEKGIAAACLACDLVAAGRVDEAVAFVEQYARLEKQLADQGDFIAFDRVENLSGRSIPESEQ